MLLQHHGRRTSLLFILAPSWTKAIEMLLVAIEDLTIAGSWKVIAAETLTVTGYLQNFWTKENYLEGPF